jgi:hypothetical protein
MTGTDTAVIRLLVFEFNQLSKIRSSAPLVNPESYLQIIIDGGGQTLLYIIKNYYNFKLNPLNQKEQGSHGPKKHVR